MDDKAKVLIGITAAKKQTPSLMHMEYQITLPDHDFVVGSKHTLIPSVIGFMKVVKGKDLTNDGVLLILVLRTLLLGVQSIAVLLPSITFVT